MSIARFNLCSKNILLYTSSQIRNLDHLSTKTKMVLILRLFHISSETKQNNSLEKINKMHITGDSRSAIKQFHKYCRILFVFVRLSIKIWRSIYYFSTYLSHIYIFPNNIQRICSRLINKRL